MEKVASEPPVPTGCSSSPTGAGKAMALLVVLVVLGGCATERPLMPTPSVYALGLEQPFADSLPADLRSPAVQSKPDGDLFKSVSYGVPGGRQPPLHTTITIDDRWHVIAFIKSLGNR